MNLRQTCKGFAASAIIKAALFTDLTLEATEEQLQPTEKAKATFFAPFVRKLEILPSLYNVDLSLEDFKSFRPDSDLTVEDAFDQYNRRAQYDANMIKSGELEAFWTQLFQNFNVIKKLDLPTFMCDHPILLPLPDQDEYGPDFAPYHRPTLRDSSRSNYNQVFETVVRCLAHTNVKVEAIHIDCELALAYDGWSGNAWKQLSLSRLQDVRFVSSGLWDDDWTLHVQNHAITVAVSNVLATCPPSLQKFELDRNVDFPRILAPHFGYFGLRQLRSLYLGGVLIDVLQFAQDVANMPTLKGLSLRDCHPEPRGQTWKPLLQAIHHHAKPMRIRFDHFWGLGSHEWTFIFRLDPTKLAESSEFEKLLAGRGQSNDLELFRYLEGRGMWSTKMEEYYGVWD